MGHGRRGGRAPARRAGALHECDSRSAGASQGIGSGRAPLGAAPHASRLAHRGRPRLGHRGRLSTQRCSAGNAAGGIRRPDASGHGRRAARRGAEGMNDALLENCPAGISLPPELVDTVRRAYASARRAYHDIHHVEEVIRRFAEVARDVGWQRPREVYLALLFHDAVYVPGSTDNETQSAELARDLVARYLPDPTLDRDRIAQLILLTCAHGKLSPSDVDPEAALFLDCDMAILGSDLEASRPTKRPSQSSTPISPGPTTWQAEEPSLDACWPRNASSSRTTVTRAGKPLPEETSSGRELDAPKPRCGKRGYIDGPPRFFRWGSAIPGRCRDLRHHRARGRHRHDGLCGEDPEDVGHPHALA